MVSDNDCDVAVCDIKGRGDFSPPSDFVCTLYIQNLCLRIISLRNYIFFFPCLPDFTLSIPAFILLWNNHRRMNIAVFINYVIRNTLHSIT